MKYKLVLKLGENKKKIILEREHLMNIDLITTKYEDKIHFLEAYSNKEMKNNLNHNLVIYFKDDKKNYEIDVLYKDNKKKLRSKNMINSSIKYLKENDMDVLNQILDKFIYIFLSDLNIDSRQLFCLSDSLNKNKIIKIIEKGFNTGYNTMTNTIDVGTYDNVRLIDNYITNLQKKNNKFKYSYSNLVDKFYDTLIKEEHLSMSEISYLYDEFEEEEKSHYRVYKK